MLGPLGYNIGALLTTAILALYNTLGWAAVALVAAILPFMISLGMHKALVPYAVSSIASPGFDMLYLPASLAHNISEGGACLAVALKTKNEDRAPPRFPPVSPACSASPSLLCTVLPCSTRRL